MKLLKFILGSIVIGFGWPALSQAMDRFVPAERQQLIDQQMSGRIGAIIEDLPPCNGNRTESVPINLGPSKWTWTGSVDGSSYQETWRVEDIGGRPFDPVDPYNRYDGGWILGRDQFIGTKNCTTPQVTVVMSYTTSLSGFGDRVISHLPTPGYGGRDYLVISGGRYGALLVPFNADAWDCDYQETCSAYQQGTLFSLPVMWEVELTVTTP